jgi:ABC-2 type transport system permease protein
VIQSELIKQLLRVRSLLALAALAALPVVAGVATASDAGRRHGKEGGLFGAATFSALNHTAASLQFIEPLLLPVVVALLGSAFGAADRDWGTLRYLYVQPVSRTRLLTGKLSALAICCLVATACVLVAGVLTGLVVFGWHPFHRIGTTNLSAARATARLLEAGGYVTVCMLCIGTIAFALGLVLPGSAEALGVSLAFIVVSSIADGQRFLPGLTSALPVHFWQRWPRLLDGDTHGVAAGLGAQLAAMVVVLAVAGALTSRRDPA